MNDTFEAFDAPATAEGVDTSPNSSSTVDIADLLSCSKIEHDPMASRPFHNARKPFVERHTEKPGHRVMCYMTVEGMTAIEIASELGVSPVTVRDILKQDWAQKFMAELIANKGGPAVEMILKSGAIKAAKGMEDLLQRAQEAQLLEVERKVRKDMQDRWFGTAAQVVQHVNVDPANMSDAELLKMAEQHKGN